MINCYTVEISKSPDSKSSYKVRNMVFDKAQAEFIYSCLNIGRGYRKRLRQQKESKMITLARSSSL